MAYAIGPISGCHINPAASVGVFTAGRMSRKDLVGYVVGQILGVITGAAIVGVIASGSLSVYSIATSGLGHNGWGAAPRDPFAVLCCLLPAVT